MTDHDRWLIRDFLLHVCEQHRREFPHESPIDPSTPSENCNRYFWLRGFLEACAADYQPTPHENGTEILGRNDSQRP